MASTQDIIRIQDQYYILASSSVGAEPTRVLKHGETFAVFNRYGDVMPIGLGEQGLYHLGTRHLSRFELRLRGQRPLLLSSTVREQNDLLTIDLTNPDLADADGTVFPRDILHLFRSIFLWRDSCYERLRLTNYGTTTIPVPVSFSFDADFADIFEVRGTRRERRGHFEPPRADAETLVLGYEGLDGVRRRTRIRFSPGPIAIEGTEAHLQIALEPRQTLEQLITISCATDDRDVEPAPHEEAYGVLSRTFAVARERQASLEAGNEQCAAWIRRSAADLHMMTTETTAGLYPYAGVPWFSTVFGRDGIIAALQVLWIDPALARGVLGYLAATQARETDPAIDAEPGKILHETRRGEMAALGEIPFGRYYGTVDATPLFIVLAGEYWRRTADREFVGTLWPCIEAALGWLDTSGDPDGDGFIEYHRRSSDGLVHQGWKDSQDSIFHEDGRAADGPIALCEVQGYAFAARRAAAEMADALGHANRAAALRAQAAELRDRFESAFWLDDLSTYALALDGAKQPCRIVSSNAGHCLFAGISAPDRAARVGARLLDNDMFTGWGIRTIAAGQARYNPMAYHNGSVWPHDSALVALGLSRYRQIDPTQRILEGLFGASQHLDLHRLPELFCGFRRRPGQGPTLYPVACAPQAWASGAVFMLLQATLGLTIDARSREIRFEGGQLPPFLPSLRITDLTVGDASVDLLLERHALDLGIRVLRRHGDIEILVVK